MPRIAISLGSNHDREHHLRAGLTGLQNHFSNIAASPVYETLPVAPNAYSLAEGFTYYNLVVCCDTVLSIAAVKQQLRHIEQAQQRKRGVAQVTLDLDLLVYGNKVINDGAINVPHEDIVNRAYVLQPLSDVWPHGCHPVLGITYKALWDDKKTLWDIHNKVVML